MVGSLAVAVAVVSLGMGSVNLMSADAGVRLAEFSVAKGKAPQRSSPPPVSRFADINYFREEIAARQDQMAALRRDVDLESRQLGVQQKLQDSLALAAKPDATDFEGVPMEPQALSGEIARMDTQIAEVQKRQEDTREVDVNRWISSPAEKPRWVECAKDGVTLQPQSTHFANGELQNGNAPLAAALGAARTVLLVRPSGFDSCAAAVKLLDAGHIEYSLTPIDEDWQLIFR